ncbi:RNA-directed DNA polymerase from mobile element jockey [Caerostris extrusa]|uniref:RNA-directed DNA polymerase from mobile element jockey n=1 Tax=Caerostris extrusa TaxID=172846 RepID=A0AAV4Y7Q0_CAEEX|nr:RNA-directed DNA polymerase from mobile element jockey [Caerostris extrusa]
MELISELHAFQTQLEYLHNCMQVASNSDKDVKLVAQTNDLVQKVEVLINNLGVPLAKLPATPVEAERIKMAVEERRNPKPPTSKPTEAKLATQHQNSATPKKATQAEKKKPKRRIEDDDGFILPAKHLVARNKPATAVPAVQISSNTNHFTSTNPTPEVADEWKKSAQKLPPKTARQSASNVNKPIQAPQPRTQPPAKQPEKFRRHYRRNDRVNTTTLPRGGRTCIYIKNALVHHQIPTPTLTSTEATIVKLKITEKSSIVFISIYCIVGKGAPFDDLKKLQKIHNNVVFAGDFNATHTSWNNSKSNQRGVQLNKFLKENNHRIIAPTSATRIDPRYNAQNIIDFATFKNIPYPATAAVFHELSSDHLPCLLDINLNVKPQTIPNLFITNWDDYNFNLQRTNLKLTIINNEEDADTAIENFTKDLYAALNNSSKPKYLNIKGRLPKRD